MSLVTDEMVSIIKLARKRGYKCHEISSFFCINQGRISDVMHGRIGSRIPPAEKLPDGFPALH